MLDTSLLYIQFHECTVGFIHIESNLGPSVPQLWCLELSFYCQLSWCINF